LNPEDSRLCWVALNFLGFEGLKSARKALERFPSVTDLFHAERRELERSGIDAESVGRIISGKALGRAEKELAKLEKRGERLITAEDGEYPDLLREIYDPPLVLYCAGKAEALKGPAVAIVGTRKPSPYGRAVAEKLAAELASRELVIVSGLARGIDSSAHWGALKEGRSVAVLGSGLDVVYPKENALLARKIRENGAVVSEYPLGTMPLGRNFPVRNRIISGLSLGLLVVEAAQHSGSLISAGLALDQNREVMAVPGHVTSELSRETHWLIQKGARLVESWEDVADGLPSPWREEILARGGGPPCLPPPSVEENEILEKLPPDAALPIDAIVEATGRTVADTLAVLLNLELKGLVLQSAGKCFQMRI